MMEEAAYGTCNVAGKAGRQTVRMAKIVYALNQSLAAFVDQMAFQPDPVFFM
jgi:hypothetical protein